MTLPELLEKIGADNLKFQLLSQSIDGNVTRTKDGIRYSFLSDVPMEEVIFGDHKEALIVWVDRAEMQRILREAKDD